jgi:hypothetical protein
VIDVLIPCRKPDTTSYARTGKEQWILTLQQRQNFA